MYDQDELLALVDPDLAGTVEDVLTEHADIYQDNDLDRLRQPHVPGRRPDVPARA